MSAVLALLAPVAAALALVLMLAPSIQGPRTLLLRVATVVLLAPGLASLLAVGRSLGGIQVRAGAFEAVVLVAAVAVLAVVGGRRTGLASAAVVRVPRSHGVRVARIALAVAVSAAVVAVVRRGLRHPDGMWDAISFWTYRARLLVGAPGDTATIFRDPPGDTHADYPLLVAGTVAWVEAHVGVSRFTSMALGLLFGVGLLGAVAGTVGALRRSPAGALAALVILVMPRYLTLAPAGYADLPLAAMFAGGLGWAAVATEAEDSLLGREALRLSGLVLGLGLWTKNEGSLQLLAAVAALLVLRPPRVSRRATLAALAVGAAPFLIAFTLQRAVWAPTNDLVAGQGGGTLARLLDPSRWRQIAAGFGTRIVTTKLWSYALPVVLLLLVVPRPRGPVGAGHRTMVLAVALVTVGYAFVYAVTPHDLAWHLWSSCERLMAHVVPTAVLAATLRWAGPRDALPMAEPS